MPRSDAVSRRACLTRLTQGLQLTPSNSKLQQPKVMTVTLRDYSLISTRNGFGPACMHGALCTILGSCIALVLISALSRDVWHCPSDLNCGSQHKYSSTHLFIKRLSG